jgi:hypothetical protein
MYAMSTKITVSQKLSMLLNKKYVKEVFLLWKPERKMCNATVHSFASE